tara:strand:+ start:20398 stop:20688 length:291 start_codon:yes stop_codon:yes gene_type:complete
MEEVHIPIKTTVEGEVKEQDLVLNVPENLAEFSKEYGKEKTFDFALRMLKTDKSNAARVILRGGEAKQKRAESNALAKELQSDPELMEKVRAMLAR